ncbi:MAG: magnesium/cobalt transporter CorA [Actinomycetota bacterium]
MIRTRLYRSGRLDQRDFDPALVSDFLEEPDTLVWLDFPEPGPGDLKLLEEEFPVHPLAVEDASKLHQRPKVDRYQHHLYVVAYAVWLDGGELQTAEVDAFVGDRYLITVRKHPPTPLDAVLERWDATGDLLKHGVGSLLHGLLDVIVDGYAVVADALEDTIEGLESRVLAPEADPQIQEDLFGLRRRLVTLRRVALPLQDVVSVLVRGDVLEIPEELVPYFHDIQDHLLRVGMSVDAMNELLTGAIQVHLSAVSNRLNTTMKKVTSWAAIIAVATLIAGVYGMNFRLIPPDQTLGGFWAALGIMAAASAALYAYFRRKDWL